MTLDKRTRASLLAHCGELHEDDAVDPRRFFKKHNKRDKQHHKLRQLCQQVAQTMNLVLSGEFADERLQSLQVVSVEPAPDASQLLVTLCTDMAGDAVEYQTILNQLALITGRLRSEVAVAISRKRTPLLLFRVVGPAPAGEDLT